MPISLDTQPDLMDIPGFYQSGAGNFWVATDDQKIVGTIALRDIGNRQAALRKMFVSASHRGSEYGAARTLLDVLVDWAETKGVSEIFLGTTDKFLAAHRFYAKNGFIEVTKTSLPEAFPVMAVDSKFFRRALHPDAA